MPFLAPIVGAVVSAVGGIVATVGSFIGGLGAFGTALISVGLNVAVALIQQATAKKPLGGVQFDRQYGSDVARQVAVGLIGMAGHDCYVNTFGKSNNLLQQVYVVSDYYCDGMSRVSINGAWAMLGTTADPDKGFPVVSGDFANLIWIKFFDGTQTAANSYLVANANPAARWTSAHVGLGLAFFLVSMTFDKEKNNSFPDFFFEFRGARLYDWRKDTTAGGSGSHRWGDYSTHEYTTNPVVADYNYRRGFSVNGDLFCGMEMSAADLPLNKFTAAAAICAESVLNGSGSEPRYQLSMLIDCTATHGDNIEAMMMACGGMVIDGVDGSWPLVGSDQPSVATITDDDFVTGAPFQFRAKRSMAEIVNSVSGNSPDPEQLWAMVGYEAQISDTALVVDRRTRDVSIDFPQVPSLRQAGQLASIYLEESRWEATASGSLRPRWQVLEPGDWITWASAKYGTRTMMVSEASLASLDADGPRNAQLSLQQRDGSIYDGILNPVVIVPTRPGHPDYQSELENYQLVPIIVQSETGSQRAGIRASWNAIEDETISRIDFQYRPAAQSTVIMSETATSDQAVAQLVSGVISLTDYEVRYRLASIPPRTIPWTEWVTVKTLDARLTGADFYPIDLSQLAQDVNDLQQWMASGLNGALGRLDALATSVSDTALAGYTDKQTLRRELKAQTANSRASWSEDITVATGPGSAIVAQITALSAEIDNAISTANIEFGTSATTLAGVVTATADAITALETTVNDPTTGLTAIASAVSSLSTTVTAQGGTISAHSTAITALQTSIGDVSASSTFRAETGYTPAVGWTARIGLETRISSGATFRAAGIYLESTSTQARVVISADQLAILAGGVLAALFDSGTAYIANARIRNLTAGNIVAKSLNADVVMQDGTIITDLLALKAMTDNAGTTYSVTAVVTGFTTLASFSINNVAGNPIDFQASYTIFANAASGASAAVSIRFLRNGTVLPYVSNSVSVNGGSDSITESFNIQDDGAPSGTVTYTIQYSHSRGGAGAGGGTVAGEMKARVYKR